MYKCILWLWLHKLKITNFPRIFTFLQSYAQMFLKAYISFLWLVVFLFNVNKTEKMMLFRNCRTYFTLLTM